MPHLFFGIVEVESTGREDRDFTRMERIRAKLRQSILVGPYALRRNGVKVQADMMRNDKDSVIVPFFGYDAASMADSTVFPGYKPEHGVRRYFGLDICTGGCTLEAIMGTYDVSEPKFKATFTLCGCQEAEPAKHELQAMKL
jgi:hypothetical protein